MRKGERMHAVSTESTKLWQCRETDNPKLFLWEGPDLALDSSQRALNYQQSHTTLLYRAHNLKVRSRVITPVKNRVQHPDHLFSQHLWHTLTEFLFRLMR